jgi:hypothetical protein
VRGGSIPLLAWGTLLVILMVINWIWAGDAIQVGTFAAAVLAVFGGAAAFLALAPRESLRRGAPPHVVGAEAVPRASAGALLFGLGVASIVFGLVFGTFPIFFGIGLVLAGLGRLAMELRAERESRVEAAERVRRETPE